MRHSSRSGMFLMVVVFVLALLAVLALAFVQMTALERTTSTNYVHQIRSRLHAESGVEFAITQLLPWAGRVPTGEFLDMMKYEPGGKPGMEHATRSSFPDSSTPAVAQYLPGTFSENGDYAVLRVTAEDGKLNLNDSNARWNVDTDAGLPDGDPAEDIGDNPKNEKGRMWYLIRELAAVVLDPAGSNPALADTVADAILAARAALPGQRFTSVHDVEDVLVPAVLDADQFEAFYAECTLYSWQDPRTLRPTFQYTQSKPGIAGFPAEWMWDVYLPVDFMTRQFDIEPRCPVNVNAASAAMLEALVRPLQGWYLREGPGSCATMNHRGCAWMGGEHTPMPIMEYYPHDCTNSGVTGERNFGFIAAFTPPGNSAMGDNAVSRFGQAVKTPELTGLLGGEFPRRFAQALHDRIHNGAGDPVETWQEFEFAVETILAGLFPDVDAGLDVFWQSWKPRPSPYDMNVRWSFMLATGAFTSPMPTGAGMMAAGEVDVSYWRPACRGILRDLLLAAFNPNSQLNDFNPDRHLWRWIDKAQLTQYTTELVFQTTGAFRIDSAGVIENETGGMVAKTEVHSVVELCRPVRFTTQAQFMDGFKDQRDYAADPAAAFDSPPVAWNTMVQSYPEPLLKVAPGIVEGDGRYLAESIHDGYLMPSTWEPVVTGGAGETMAVHFDGRLQPAFLAPVLAPLPPVIPAESLQEYNPPVNAPMGCNAIWPARPDSNAECGESMGLLYRLRNLPAADRLTHPLTSGKPVPEPAVTAPMPGGLYPDGAISEPLRGLGWRATNIGSLEGRVGAAEFWFKPNFNPECSTRIRCLFNAGRDRGCWGGSSTRMGDLFQMLGVWYFPHYGYSTSEIVETTAYSPYLSSNGRHDECYRALSPNCLGFMATNMLPCLQPGWGGSCYAGSTSAKFMTETQIISPTVVGRFPNQDESQRAKHNSYYFDAHSWSHIALSWQVVQSSPTFPAPVTNFLQLAINGRNPGMSDGAGQSRTRTGILSGFFNSGYSWGPCYMHTEQAVFPYNSKSSRPTWVRFGGLASESALNYSSDATYDEIVCYKTQAIPASTWNPLSGDSRYRREARYYNPAALNELAVYQSPEFDMLAEAGIDRSQATVLSMAWTAYWPKYNERRNYKSSAAGNVETPHLQALNANDNDPQDPLAAILGWSEALDPMSFDVGLVSAAGTAWLRDSNGDGEVYDDWKNTFTYAGGSRLAWVNDKAAMTIQRGQGLRFRAYFNQAPNQVAYEAPVLDDVTFFLRADIVWLWQEVRRD